MKLRKLFKKKQKEEEIEEYRNLSVEDALALSSGTQEEKKTFTVADTVKDNVQRISELKKRLKDSKDEYGAITAYLTDIQRIDMLTPDQRGEIQDAARQITNLSKERGKFQEKERMENIQMRYLAQFENELPQELKKLFDEEKYQMLVKEDLRQLEGERGTINYECESAVKKNSFVKKFAVGSCISVFILFLVLLTLGEQFEANLNLPFFLIGILALTVTCYVVIELRNTQYTIKYSGVKMNKLISLVNKVKIKYVNITSVIDYSYEKYRVNSASELSFLWEKYVRVKEEEARYRHNTELLEFYNEELSEGLRAHGLTDPEIWVYQTEALLDDKEMVEVRHRLNNRRQKLRERMEADMSQLESICSEQEDLKEKYPELEDEF